MQIAPSLFIWKSMDDIDSSNNALKICKWTPLTALEIDKHIEQRLKSTIFLWIYQCKYLENVE